MNIFSAAANLVTETKKPLNTKNKNEVLYVQKLINVLYKSPVVQKEKGKVFKLVEDGVWGAKTAAAVQYTWNKIPSRAEMVNLQNKYAELAAAAVNKAASGKGTTSSFPLFTNIFLPAVTTTIAKQVADMVTGKNLPTEKKILEPATTNARRVVENKTTEAEVWHELPGVTVRAKSKTAEEIDNPFTPSNNPGNKNSIILAGVALVGLVLLIK